MEACLGFKTTDESLDYTEGGCLGVYISWNMFLKSCPYQFVPINIVLHSLLSDLLSVTSGLEIFLQHF